MSWSFRFLVLSITLLWAAAPQIACWMPDHHMTQEERDCCEQMAHECHRGPSMSHDCCQTDVRDDLATSGKRIDPRPDFDFPITWNDVARSLTAIAMNSVAIQNSHSPPHEITTASTVLRI